MFFLVFFGLLVVGVDLCHVIMAQNTASDDEFDLDYISPQWKDTLSVWRNMLMPSKFIDLGRVEIWKKDDTWSKFAASFGLSTYPENHYQLYLDYNALAGMSHQTRVCILFVFEYLFRNIFMQKRFCDFVSCI